MRSTGLSDHLLFISLLLVSFPSVFLLANIFSALVHLWTLREKIKTFIQNSICVKYINVKNFFGKNKASTAHRKQWKYNFKDQHKNVWHWNYTYKNILRCFIRFLFFKLFSNIHNVRQSVESHACIALFSIAPQKNFNWDNLKKQVVVVEGEGGVKLKSSHALSYIRKIIFLCYIKWRISLQYVNSMALNMWEEAYAYVC